MPLAIPAGSAEIIYSFARTGDPEPQSFAVACTGITDIDSLADACGNALSAWGSTGCPNGALSSAMTLLHIEGRTSPTGTNLVYDLPVNIPGEGGPDTLPSNCAVLVRKISAAGGRANRGRIYIPGVLADGQVDLNGRIDSTALTDLQDAFTNWFTTWNLSGDYPLVLLHSTEVRDPAFPPPSKQKMPNPHTTPTVVTSVQVDPVIGTQRRRLR